jgi:hypothetical protein
MRAEWDLTALVTLIMMWGRLSNLSVSAGVPVRPSFFARAAFLAGFADTARMPNATIPHCAASSAAS